MRRQTIALAVIARDEADNIGRMLQSISAFVDHMVVVDTGSTDSTAESARRLGAQVVHTTWQDDFAQARNMALEAARADWNLVLDADEWLIDGGPFLQRLAHARPDFVGAVALEDHRGPQRSTHWLSRLLPGHVRYEGCVHEQPVHRLPTHRVPLKVGHDGYGDKALARKRGRNRRLLQKSLLARPDDAYLLYQLGKDEAVYDEHALASDHLLRACAKADDAADWRPDLVARCLYSLKRAGRHTDAAALAAQEIDKADQTLCTQSPDVFFALGDVMLDWAAQAPERAVELLDQAEQAWTLCLELGERPDITGSVHGRGSHLAAHNLALVYEGTGRPGQAQQLREQFGVEVSISMV